MTKALKTYTILATHFAICYALNEIMMKNNNETLLSSVECVVKFIEHNFKLKPIMVYKESEHRNEETALMMQHLIKKIMITENYNLEVHASNESYCAIRYNLIHQQYLVYVDNSTGLSLILDKWLCSQWSPASHFIIIVHSSTDVGFILDVLYTNYIFKAFVLKITDGYVTYRRTRPRCPGNENFTMETRYDCSSDGYKVDIFNKHNIWNCKYRFGVRLIAPYVFKISEEQKKKYSIKNSYLGTETGIVLETLKMTIFRGFNVSDDHSLGEFDPVTRNETGLIKALHESIIDILMGALYLHTYSPNIEPSYPILHANLVCIVKKSKSYTFHNLYGVFPADVWIFTLSVNALFIILVYTAATVKRDLTMDIVKILIYIIEVLVGKGITLKRHYLRFLFVFWIWFAFVLRASFEALLLIVLLNKNTIQQINTLEELCEKNYKILISDINYAYFKGGLYLPGCYIPYENFILVDDPLTDLAKSESDLYAVIMYDKAYNTLSKKFIDEDGGTPFHLVNEIIHLCPLSQYFRRGDPLLDVYNKRGAMILESGIVDYYETIGDNFEQIFRARLLRSKNISYALAMKQEIVIFYLYFCGVTVSIIAFAIENVTFVLRKRLLSIETTIHSFDE